MTVTTAGMRAFRSAATLADVLPRVRIQVHDGERTLLTVSRTPLSDDDAAGMVVPPCRFRVVVAHAWRAQRHGFRFQFLDLPLGQEPAIHVGLPAGDVTLPGYIYRCRVSSDRHLYLFITGLGVGACDEAIATALATTKGPTCPVDGLDPDGVIARRIGFHADPVTELTAVHALADTADSQPAGRLMARLLEICVAAEMVADLEASPPPSRNDIAP